jgi:ATP-dependent exoDNAse (exonuclease V) alpha subunit
MGGSSVFLTGAPGAGKSYLVNEYVQRSTKHGRRTAVTASTGIAATHIGGTTVHSWSGLGVRQELQPRDLDTLASNDRLVKRYNSIDTLLIDEISMLQGQFLDMLDTLARVIRGADAPFGGLQMILVGDMFQLPPITRGSSDTDFAHQSRSWRDLDPSICYLKEQHRQSGDDLEEILTALRSSSMTPHHRSLLESRLRARPQPGEDVTMLYSHNVDVDTINSKRLAQLPGPSKRYVATSRGSGSALETLKRGVLAPTELELKVGSEVMFVANDPNRSYVNGSLGRVDDLTAERPTVTLARSGRVITVDLHTWTLEEDGVTKAEIRQLPLRLAWAITIHKSQGMSLDAAEIDLSRSFTPGMGYVALSRVRNLEGLYLLRGLNEMALTLSPEIFDFDQRLQRSSALLAAQTPDFPEDSPNESPDEPSHVEIPVSLNPLDEQLLTALKSWRRHRSRMDGVPPYVIAHDVTLEEIARLRPQNEAAYRQIKGMGPARWERYGKELLDFTKEDRTTPIVTIEQRELWGS